MELEERKSVTCLSMSSAEDNKEDMEWDSSKERREYRR